MDNLNVKVGDVVRVYTPNDNHNPSAYYCAIVEKVMPNGRFKLSDSNTYWKANGKHNTKAHKLLQDEYVEKGNLKDCETMYRSATIIRLMTMNNYPSMLSLHSIETLTIFNRVLSSFGIEGQERLEQLEKTIIEQRLKGEN